MAVKRLPFTELKSFSRLFTTYAGDFETIAGFFAGDYRDPRQRGQIAKQVADQFSHRREVSDVLGDQNRAFGMGDKTLSNIDRLSNADAVAVVTGQQLGLFTGPLYTLYKTITAIQLAKKLESELGRPVVPVFWLEGEDHDFDEIASVHVQGRSGPVQIAYTPENGVSDPIPVGRLQLSDHIQSSIDQFESALPPTEFRDRILQTIRDAYKPGVSFMDAFVDMMSPLFREEGLVFISGDDVRLKRLAQPLFRKELKDPAKSTQLVHDAGAKLIEAYHAQVQTSPSNLFLISENGRHSLEAENGSFKPKGTDDRYSLEELLSRLEEHPDQFSPNVVLRPVFQDTILPTAAYVAGPGEVAYFAQFRGIYEWAGVPMPIVYPRASVSLVEKNIDKVLARYDIGIPTMAENLDQIFRALVVDAMNIDADAIFDRAGQHLHDAVNTVAPAIGAVDQSLVQSTEATRTLLFKEWDRLKERVVKAEKRRHDQMRAQLEKCQVNLFPNGILQERCISPVYFMNKYGVDLVNRLVQEIELDTTSHQVLSI